jgi:hypothetical protein
MAEGKGSSMKSAYELALERLERQGIERPREGALPEATLERMAEVRRQAEAKLAELEILHRDRLKGIYDPAARDKEGEDYVLERRRVEAERDRKLDRLRAGG